MSLTEYLEKHKLTIKDFSALVQLPESTIKNYVEGRSISTHSVWKIFHYTKGEISFVDMAINKFKKV